VARMPKPYSMKCSEVDVMLTRDEINKQLQDLRTERDAALRQVDLIQDCMNELMRKRKLLALLSK